ncbi:MAG: type II secretion system F family protein [Candidatus Omnitrophica bacterium]|nr:type II secretion system F family protein [Candidatus Omnitrophota bacterium]
MAIFEYRAKEGPAKIITGTVRADNEAAAVLQLSLKKIVPLELKEIRSDTTEKKASHFKVQKVTLKDTYTFTYQLVDLLGSGLTLHKALDTIVTQVEKTRLKEILSDVSRQVKGGMSFSKSLEMYKKIFNVFYINMIRAGEASGRLEHVLMRLATTLEKEDDFRNRIKQAFVYPSLIGICGIATVIAILTFVIPRLESMYADLGQGLPFITMLVIKASHGFLTLWWFIALIAIVFVWWIKRQIANTETASTLFDFMVMKIPVWGHLMHKEEIGRFARSLGMLQEGGLTILESLLVAKDILRSAALKKDIGCVHDKVRNGSKIHVAMKEMKSFSPLIINMVATGEESGMLSKSLERVAHSYEKDVDMQIKVITTLIEPLLVLCIGLLVGIIVISMLLPIFQINIFVR